MQPMIPLFKVYMSPDACEAVAAVLASGYVAEGPVVAAFEEQLAEFLQDPQERTPLTTNSCTSALDLALHLADVRRGDVVISTPMTCTATNSAIVNRGAKIQWADIDPISGNISPDDVEMCMSTDVRAIMAVDWGGIPCDYRKLRDFGVPVIQDAAHSFGYSQVLAEKGGGDYTCYSFQAIKHLTTGDGGALLCPPDEYERARKLRWFGLDRTSPADFRAGQIIEESGYKYHMNDVAAAIGIENLRTIDERLDANYENAAEILAGLDDWMCGQEDASQRGIVQAAPIGGGEPWFLTLHVHNRDLFMKHMADCGIQTSLVHARNDRHPIFPDAPDEDYPGLAAFSQSYVAVPCGWWLSELDIDRIVSAVEAWVK